MQSQRSSTPAIHSRTDALSPAIDPRPLRSVPPPTQRGSPRRLATVTPIRREPHAIPASPRPNHLTHEAGPAIHPTLITRLALFAVEVLDGVRSASQLSSVVSEQVLSELKEVAQLRAEKRAVNRDRRRSTPMPSGRVLGCRPFPHIIEATVMMHCEPRPFPVALRLEYSAERGRWRATSITVL